MADDGRSFLLHHYEASPYAEKIRLMFGVSGAAWGSVLSPPFPPRPNVDPLAGGYRRIPVAQLGADIFCDTSLISAEVAAFTERSELSPGIEDADARALAERAEGDVFFAAITSVPPLKLLGKLLLTNGPFATMKFVKDRTGMMKGASVRPPQGEAAVSVFDAFLNDLNSFLADRDYLQGSAPTYADFCAHHPVWLSRNVGGPKPLRDYANVKRWLAAMDGLGHGRREEKGPEVAFKEAETFEPRQLPADAESHDAVGKKVSIAPADYGKVAVTGTLVAANDERYIVARSTDRFGTIHVHFAKDGYVIST